MTEKIIYILTIFTFLNRTNAFEQLNVNIDKIIDKVENQTKGLMEDGKAMVLDNYTTSNDNDTHSYMIQKEKEKLSIIPMFPVRIKSSVKNGKKKVRKMEALLKKYNKISEKLKKDAAVQGGSFNRFRPIKPNKALQLDRKIPKKCRGKDSCHDFRLCKLCAPYWAAIAKEANADEEVKKDKVGIDAEDYGYEDAYKGSSETEEDYGYGW